MHGLKLVNPYAFGYKTVWIAVKSENPNEVFRVLGKYKVTGNVFNTPINGFVLVEDINVNELLDDEYIENDDVADEEKLSSENIVLLKNLSNELGMVCFFLTHRTSDVHEWLKAENGVINRAFHYYAMVNLNYGLTPEEEKLGCDFSDFNEKFGIDDEYDKFPDEECVIKIASSWTTNPLDLYDNYGEKPSELESFANDANTNDSFKTPKNNKIKLLMRILGIGVVLLSMSARVYKSYLRIDRYRQNQQQLQTNRPTQRTSAKNTIPDDVELTSLITLTLDDDFLITRTDIPDFLGNVSWVILEDGKQVLHRNDDNENQYEYFSNDKGKKYEVYLESFIDDKYQRVSNTITYEP